MARLLLHGIRGRGGLLPVLRDLRVPVRDLRGAVGELLGLGRQRRRRAPERAEPGRERLRAVVELPDCGHFVPEEAAPELERSVMELLARGGG